MDIRERNMRGMDGRNPYGSRGGYVVSRRSRRGRRGDMGMDYARQEDMRRDMNYTGSRGNYPMNMPNYNYDMARGNMGNNYEAQSGYDGHYPQSQGSTYYPIEAMGVFNGYYGMPEQDYARNGRRDYAYDMRYDMRSGDYARVGRRDYGYDYRYNDYGDYGENLSDEELKEWEHKLLSKLSDQEKQVFNKDAIMQKIKQMGIKMDEFSEKELYVNTLANYTDHKKSIGMNPDLAIKLAYDDFCDDDSKYEGGEWLSVYFDTFVDLDK